MKRTIFCIACLVIANIAFSQPTDCVNTSQKQKLNFFIVSKRHKGKLDLASRFNTFRTKVKSLLRQKRFVSIVARNANCASAKIQYRLRKYDARIGTIWFDSHGMYKKGYSLFFIGTDEYNYKTLKDSLMAQPLEELAVFSDLDTRIIIGSCYGGATYERSSIDYKDTTRMNGDSLMMALGSLFNKSCIYACESWVMSKPGLFLKKAAVAGYPGRKLFRDICYKPAWEHVGKWNQYNASDSSFRAINPVTLNTYGDAIVRTVSYSDKEDTKRKIEKNLGILRTGLYK